MALAAFQAKPAGVCAIMGNRQIIKVPPDANGRLDVWLTGQIKGLSRTRIKKLLENGHIRINDRQLAAHDKVRPGMLLTIEQPEPEPSSLTAENIPLNILYEDTDLLVLNKPAGLVVHPAAGHYSGTLVHALLHHCPQLPTLGGERRPGIVHRLDKDTSGVMLVAKGEQAMARLSRDFHDGRILKEYIALVLGVPHPQEGRIEANIERHPVHRKKMHVSKDRGRRAVSEYKAEQVFDGYSLVRIRLHTGRTHQIRVHMAHIGNPVLGDATYGSSARERRAGLSFCAERQLLHAETIGFTHPRNGRSMQFSAPWPDDMKILIK